MSLEPAVRAVVTVAAASVAAEKPTSIEAVEPASTTTFARETASSGSTGSSPSQDSPLTVMPVGAVAAPVPMKPKTSLALARADRAVPAHVRAGEMAPALAPVDVPRARDAGAGREVPFDVPAVQAGVARGEDDIGLEAAAPRRDDVVLGSRRSSRRRRPGGRPPRRRSPRGRPAASPPRRGAIGAGAEAGPDCRVPLWLLLWVVCPFPWERSCRDGPPSNRTSGTKRAALRKRSQAMLPSLVPKCQYIDISKFLLGQAGQPRLGKYFASS